MRAELAPVPPFDRRYDLDLDLDVDRPDDVASGQAARDALLAWGEVHLRDLPWRHTRDPWAVLVSEVMAQQTGVDRVVPYYLAFLDRFPDPASCAATPVGDVLRLWAGLGYNRRAVSLHRCAQEVVARHDGAVPDDLDALLALPGIGPYTARAILAFAYEQAAGVVDTNVGRVLARWSGRALRTAHAQRLADSLVPEARSWLWNQSMMELGGAVCRRRTPDCGRCPVIELCGWHSAGRVTPDPADGSAGVSQPQARFAGSDRQGRGRLVDALRRGPVAAAAVPRVMGWPDDPDRAARVAVGVLADGLARREGDHFRLP
ncbi:MAG: A/G-specific adenine glycosylase [Acidimicrobiales bacterium]